MEKKRPVIVLCPARNEEDNLKKHIPAWQLFADHIIIADQHSDDKTRQVASQFEKVIVIDNNDPEVHEGDRNRLLINKAREITNEGVLVHLDADETLSANILYSAEWRSFLNQQPGTVGLFEWMAFWHSPFKYLNTGRYIFSFIDDGRQVDSGRAMHSQRGVGTGQFVKEFYFNEIVNLHFAFMNPRMIVRKNNWYKAYFVVNGSRSRYRVNINHNWFYHIRPRDLLSAPDHWLAGYAARGIDITSTILPDLLWYEIDILRWFGRYGEKKFFFLDIWRGVDWEQMRKLALSRGLEGIPVKPIKKPNPLILFLNGLGTRKFSLFSFLEKVKNRLFRVILP